MNLSLRYKTDSSFRNVKYILKFHNSGAIAADTTEADIANSNQNEWSG